MILYCRQEKYFFFFGGGGGEMAEAVIVVIQKEWWQMGPNDGYCSRNVHYCEIYAGARVAKDFKGRYLYRGGGGG